MQFLDGTVSQCSYWAMFLSSTYPRQSGLRPKAMVRFTELRAFGTNIIMELTPNILITVVPPEHWTCPCHVRDDRAWPWNPARMHARATASSVYPTFLVLTPNSGCNIVGTTCQDLQFIQPHPRVQPCSEYITASFCAWFFFECGLVWELFFHLSLTLLPPCKFEQQSRGRCWFANRRRSLDHHRQRVSGVASRGGSTRARPRATAYDRSAWMGGRIRF